MGILGSPKWVTDLGFLLGFFSGQLTPLSPASFLERGASESTGQISGLSQGQDPDEQGATRLKVDGGSTGVFLSEDDGQQRSHSLQIPSGAWSPGQVPY